LTARADTVGSQIHILVRRCLALIPYHERGSCTIECARTRAVQYCFSHEECAIADSLSVAY
jgi:hypothetical protein